MALAMGLTTLFSCSDDNNSTPADNGLKVTTAETAIKAAGGAASIEVDKQVAEAYASDSWLKLSVDGNKVSASAERNDSRESRFSTVVIKASETDSTVVSVSQLGTVFGYTGGAVYVENKGGKAQKYVLHNAEFHVKSTPDWISANVEGDSVYVDVAQNADGKMRRGYVEMQSGDYIDTLTVMQASFDESIAGNYYMDYLDVTLDDNGSISSVQEQITTAEIYTFNNYVTFSLTDAGLVWNAEYDPATFRLWFNSGQLSGIVQHRYFVYEVLLNEDFNFDFTTNNRAYFQFGLTNGDNPVKVAQMGGHFLDADALGFVFWATTQQGLTSENVVGYLSIMAQPMLIDADAVSVNARPQLSYAQKKAIERKAKAMLFAKRLSGQLLNLKK